MHIGPSHPIVHFILAQLKDMPGAFDGALTKFDKCFKNFSSFQHIFLNNCVYSRTYASIT